MAKYVFPLGGAAVLLGIIAAACTTDSASNDPLLDGGIPGQDAANDSGNPNPITDAAADASKDAGPDAPPTPQTYAISATVTGLKGTGLVLQNNGGDDLTVTADGSFAFKTKLAAGKPYNVTIKTQPTAPAQQCSLSASTGTVGTANVTTIVVNCTTDKFTVSGTVTGLAGSGLVLQNNGGDDATVGSNGPFAFTPIDDHGAFAVTVKTDPSNLAQTCTVANGSGTLASANVSNVAVTCVTKKFSVGGSVTGLEGSGLVLVNVNGDEFPVTGNGPFTFGTKLDDGTGFAVTVKSDPKNPQQQCQVSGGSGTLAGGDVSSVTVNCATDKFLVGGTVTGLEGTGLVLQNNNGDDLPVTKNGDFSFHTTLDDLAAYTVGVAAQPTNKWQDCKVVANGSGKVAAANVTNIAVVCTTNEYKVKANVSGLDGSGLVLQNNAGNDLSISTNGTFEFSQAIASGSGYLVTTSVNPTGNSQTCTVATVGHSGTIAGSDVEVAVTCTTNHYTVGGTVFGLAAGNGVVLQNNLGDDLTVNGDGSFTFDGELLSGQGFDVTVLTDPTTPNQTCKVTGGGGSVTAGNIDTVYVNCATNEYTVSGTVTGLDGVGLVLQNNGADDKAVNGSSFSFSAQHDGSPFAVTVKDQPTVKSQTCEVTNDTGNLAGGNVTNVLVTCSTNTYDVGGTLSGLGGGTIVLTNNGVDDLALTGNGDFKFTTKTASGSAYAVAIKTQPAGQTCSTSSESGNVTSGAISTVTVSCGCLSGYLLSGGTCIQAPTGGTITSAGGYRIHTFTSAGSFVVPTGFNVEYLVVAGGGGGGAGDGAGGGAGGVLTGTTAVTATTFPIVIGNGGSPGTGEVGVLSQNGGSSSFAGIVAIGGGRGGQETSTGGTPSAGNAGGTGGSGGGYGGCNPLAVNNTVSSGTAGQGNAGGVRGSTDATRCGMGGGGGAGAAGGNGTGTNGGGAGGIGIQSSISGTARYYGGGGGGAGRSAGGTGGQGGGGNGSVGGNGTAGTANTGGGGGGGGDQYTVGGFGGTGIVIIRYPVTP